MKKKEEEKEYMSKVSKIAGSIKRHKKLAVFGSIILGVAIVSTVVIGNAKQKAEQMKAVMNQVQTSTVEKRTLVSSVSATGTLTSVNSKDVAVNLSGVEVKSVSVELGDMVEEGQLLCEFDSEDIAENLAEAKTALNVTNQKTQMELTNAERNLADAKEDYDTDLKRGNTDLGLAYNDYVEALEDVEEAEANLAEAKVTTIEKKGELEFREEQLKEKQEQLNTAGSSSVFEAEFANSRELLGEYIETNNGMITSSAMDKIGLGNDLSAITVGADDTYDFSSGDAAIQNEISSRIEALKTLQFSYNTSRQLENEYASLQQEVSEWQTKYNTAKSNESSLEKSYEQAVSTSESKLQSYDKQKRTLEDTTKSAENNVISKTDSLTTAQLNALSSGNSEEDKVEEYQQQLEDCTVEAPFSGVISAVNIEVGDTYNGTAIVTIDDISSFEVTAQIDEYDIAKIEKGQKVMIKTNATGEEELEGTVKIVSPKASGSGNEVTYTVIISVDTPNEMLRMDMTAKLSIILESKENVLTVPYEVLQEDESGNYYVEVVDHTEETALNNNADKTQPNIDKVNMSEMPEGMELENIPEMPEGMEFGNMPEMPKGSEGSRPQGMGSKNNQKMPGGSSVGNADVATRRVYVEKGIESDYYIEIVSSEITEGMEVVVPKTEAESGGNIQMMMMRQGPMGGF